MISNKQVLAEVGDVLDVYLHDDNTDDGQVYLTLDNTDGQVHLTPDRTRHRQYWTGEFCPPRLSSLHSRQGARSLSHT